MPQASAIADPRRAALIVTDIQPDFLPGGALSVADGNRVLEPARALLTSGRFGLYVATQDWHPRGHVSFASSHGRPVYDVIDLYGHDQTLWPDHCVQGSPGAQLYADLPWNPISVIVRKGVEPEVDSYSTFRNNWNVEGKRPATGLGGYLRERGIDEVFLCGLARDFCVKWSAEDAADAGFRVSCLWDATAPVDPRSDQQVAAALEAKGVRIISSADVLR